jgi:hypothetical protein
LLDLEATHAKAVTSYEHKLATVTSKLSEVVQQLSRMKALSSSDTAYDVAHARKQWIAEEGSRRQLLMEKLEKERSAMKKEVARVQAEREGVHTQMRMLRENIQSDVEATLACCHLLKNIAEYAASDSSFGLVHFNPDASKAMRHLLEMVSLPDQHASFLLPSEARAQDLELAVALLDDCLQAMKVTTHAKIRFGGHGESSSDDEHASVREEGSQRAELADRKAGITRKESSSTAAKTNLLEYVTNERDRYRSASVAEKKKQMSLFIALKSTERLLAQTKEQLEKQEDENTYLKSPDWSSKALSSYRTHGRTTRSALASPMRQPFLHTHNASPANKMSSSQRSPARPHTSRGAVSSSARRSAAGKRSLRADNGGARGFSSGSPRFARSKHAEARPSTANTLTATSHKRRADPVAVAQTHGRLHSAGKVLNKSEFFKFNSVWARSLTTGRAERTPTPSAK